MQEKSCECGCGSTFEPKRPWQKFVNNQHRINAFKLHSTAGKDLVCPHCGEAYNALPQKD